MVLTQQVQQSLRKRKAGAGCEEATLSEWDCMGAGPNRESSWISCSRSCKRSLGGSWSLIADCNYRVNSPLRFHWGETCCIILHCFFSMCLIFFDTTLGQETVRMLIRSSHWSCASCSLAGDPSKKQFLWGRHAFNGRNWTSHNIPIPFSGSIFEKTWPRPLLMKTWDQPKLNSIFWGWTRAQTFGRGNLLTFILEKLHRCSAALFDASGMAWDFTISRTRLNGTIKTYNNIQ